MKRAIGVLIAVWAVIVLLSCAGVGESSALAALVIGWLRYARESLPRVRYDWPRIGSAAVWLALFAIGLHLFCRWFYRERTGGGRWHVRWTAMGVGLVMLMFATGTAAVGVVHQVMFLRTGPKVYDYPRYRWDDGGGAEQAVWMCEELLTRAREHRLPAAQILRAEVSMSTAWGYSHAHFDLAGVDGPDGVIEALIMSSRYPDELARDGAFVATTTGKSFVDKARTPRAIFAELARAAPQHEQATTAATTRPK